MKHTKFLIDIDGVLYSKGKVVQGAIETLEYLDKNKFDYILVTNTTRMSTNRLILELEASGFDMENKEDRVLTALSATADYISREKEGALCYLIAPHESDIDFIKKGLLVTRSERLVDYVVIGYDTRINYQMMDRAFWNVLNGAKLIAMHKDDVFPGFPLPRIGLGAFVHGLEYSLHTRAVVIGKPNKNFYKIAMKKIHATLENTVMVGDSLVSDILGAKNAGLGHTVMVKTGNFNEAAVNASRFKPDHIIDSIKDLPDLFSVKWKYID